jgi:hypothetical protein
MYTWFLSLKFHPPQKNFDHCTLRIARTFAVARLKEVVRETDTREAVSANEIGLPSVLELITTAIRPDMHM